MRICCSVLMVSVLLSACSQHPDTTNEVQPIVLAQIYKLEVALNSYQAMLIVHQPLRAETRDSIWSHADGWTVCDPLHGGGVIQCGGFELLATDDAILASYEFCRDRRGHGSWIRSQMNTDDERKSHCSAFPVTVTSLQSRSMFP